MFIILTNNLIQNKQQQQQQYNQKCTMKSKNSYLQVRKSESLTTLKALRNIQHKKSSILSQDHHKNRCNTSRSLSQSFISGKYRLSKDNGIRLPSAYYNDRSQDYMKKSRALSQKSLTYQSRDISFSVRRKLADNQLQKVMKKRSESHTLLTASTHRAISLPNRNKMKEHISEVNAKKYSQLINGGKDIRLQNRLLGKLISEKRQKSSQNVKWASPFRDTNTFKSRFQGKDIIAKKLDGMPINSNPAQLKVLNLDRLFRKKQGRLGNIVPLPMPKLQAVNSRSTLIKTIKKKDAIHEVIEQFNRLLRIHKLKKTKPRIGIRGHNFIRAPTLQQLMGIKVQKINQHREGGNTSVLQQSAEQIDQQIFIEYNQFYQKHMKKDIHLTRRLISGLKKQQNFNLSALIRFYGVFINRVASFPEKINFLSYFFIPYGQQKIQLDVLKLILQVMCEQLPPIGNLSTKNQQFLTKQEKSKIFLEALNKVLFADLRQFTNSVTSDDSQQSNFGQNLLIDKQILGVILQRNQDAVDLLIKLLIKE